MGVDITTFIQAIVLGLLLAGLFASISVALTLEVGMARIVNFAHGEFVMLGAYVVYFMNVTYGFNLLISAAIAGIAMAALSWLVFRLFLSRVLQQADHDQLLATLGLSIILVNLALIAFTANPRMLPPHDILPSFAVGAIRVPGNNLFAALVGFGMYAALWWFVNRTRWGIQMRLASTEPELALYTGVNVERMFTMSFVIGGAIAGVSGGIVALLLPIQANMGLDLQLRAFAIIVFGGMGSIPGALLGAIVLMLADSLAGVLLPGGATWASGVSFLFLLAVLVIRPNGVFGMPGR
jgi:branched-chain amino acid transport system permease protein